MVAVAAEIEILDEIIEDLNGVQDAMAMAAEDLIDHLEVDALIEVVAAEDLIDHLGPVVDALIEVVAAAEDLIDHLEVDALIEVAAALIDHPGPVVDAMIEIAAAEDLIDHPGPVVDAMIEITAAAALIDHLEVDALIEAAEDLIDHLGPVVDAMIEIAAAAALIDHLGLAADVLTETMTVNLMDHQNAVEADLNVMTDQRRKVLEIMMIGHKIETVLFVKNENVVFDLKPC